MINKYDLKYKEFLKLKRELSILGDKLKEIPWIKLEKPYQKGWIIQYDVRDDIKRRKDYPSLVELVESIKERLTDIEIDVKLLVNKVDVNHKSMRESVDRNYEFTKKHNEVLYGNGGLGHNTRLEVLERTNENFRTTHLWLFGLVVTTLMGVAKLIFFK